MSGQKLQRKEDIKRKRHAASVMKPRPSDNAAPLEPSHSRNNSELKKRGVSVIANNKPVTISGGTQKTASRGPHSKD